MHQPSNRMKAMALRNERRQFEERQLHSPPRCGA